FVERINSLIGALPVGFRFRPDQFVFVSERVYSRLRERMIHRMEHLKEDPYYSPQFDLDFSRRYAHILKMERVLLEGVAQIVNEMAVTRRLPGSSFGHACFWFIRMMRSDLYREMYYIQSPDGERVPWESEWRSCPLGGEAEAAAFYGLDDVVRANVGPPLE